MYNLNGKSTQFKKIELQIQLIIYLYTRIAKIYNGYTYTYVLKRARRCRYIYSSNLNNVFFFYFRYHKIYTGNKNVRTTR